MRIVRKHGVLPALQSQCQGRTTLHCTLQCHLCVFTRIAPVWAVRDRSGCTTLQHAMQPLLFDTESAESNNLGATCPLSRTRYRALSSPHPLIAFPKRHLAGCTKNGLIFATFIPSPAPAIALQSKRYVARISAPLK